MMQYDGFDLEKYMDDEILKDLKKTVVLDVDVSEANEKFTDVYERIESLKTALKDVGKTAEEKANIGEALSNTFVNASNIIKEKISQINADIDTASEKLAENIQKIGMARPNSGWHISLTRENESLRKAINDRKKLLQEYAEEEEFLRNEKGKEIESAFSGVEEESGGKSGSGSKIDTDKLAKYKAETDVSWIKKADMDAEELNDMYRELLERKKEIESQDVVSDNELKELGAILAEISAIAEIQISGRHFGDEKPKAKKADGKKTATPSKQEDYKFDAEETARKARALEERKRKADQQRAEAKDKKQNQEQKPEVINYQVLDKAIRQTAQEANGLREALKQSDNTLPYEATIQRIKELEKGLADLIKQKKLLDSESKTPTPEPFKADPENYKELVAWIETYQEKIANLTRAMQQGGTENGFEEDQKDLKVYEAELKRLQSLKKSIDKGTQTPSDKSYADISKELADKKAQLQDKKGHLFYSDDIERDMAEIKRLEAEIKNLQAVYDAANSNRPRSSISIGLERLRPLAQIAVSAIGTVGSAMQRLGAIAVSAGAKFLSFGWEKLKQGASASVAALGNLARSGFSLAASGAKGLVSGLGTLARSGFNLAVSGAKKFMAVLGKIGSVLGAIKGGISTFIGGLKNLSHRMTHVGGRASKGLLKGLMSIKSMLMRRVKRTFISAIFNQAKEGLQAFAQYSDSFNTAMSNIKNSASEASGNLSATLGNLVDYISPALESILGVIVKVTQALNSMMAMLNGKSTVTVAKKSTDDYAKSLGKASGAAKDLNHQLYGFDEITRQESDNGGGSSGGIQYEEKAIDSIVGTGLADKFKEIVDAIKNKEFQKAGDLIGKVFTDIINKINDKIVEFRSKATGWAKDIGEGINGLFEGVDFNALGDTLAQGFNLLFDTVGTLIDTIDFGLVGQSLGEALNGLVSGLEWDTVGSTIVGALNGIFDAAYGLFTTVDFSKLAEGLVTGIDTIIASLDTNKLSSALQAGVNGIIEGLGILIEKINWDNLSSKLFVGLTKLIDGINLEGLGETVGNALNKVVLIVQNLINSGALPALAESLGTGLSAAFANINFTDLGATLGDVVSTIANTIGTLATSIDFPSIGSKLAEGINALFDPNKGGMNWSNAVESVTNGVNNIIAGIGRLLAPASEGGVDFSKIASFLTTTLNGLLTGINWNGLASAVGTGVNGIISALGSILTSDVLTNLATKLGGIVNTLLDKIDWGNLGTIITNGVASILEAFGTLATTIDFPKLAQSLAEGINSLFDPEKGGVKWDGAIKAVSEGVNNIIAGIGKLLAPADEGGINFTAIAEFLMKAINGLLDNVNWEGLATAVSTGVNGILDALGAILTSDTLVNLATNLGNTVNTLLTNINWTQLGTDIGTGIGTLATAFGKLIETIDLPTIATNLASGVNALFDPEQGGANLDALGELVSTALNNIVAAFGNLIAPAEEGGINFENISKFLSDNINTLIAEGDFDGLLTTAGNIILSIGTKLLETIADIDWATLGTKLADGLSGIFNDAEGNFDQTKFERLGQALSEGLKSLLEGISNLLTGIDLEAVVSGIVEFVKQLDLTSVIKTILDTLFTLIPNIVDAIPTLLQGIVDLITQLDFADILTAFVTGMGAVMKKGPELLSSILETLVDGLVALLANTDWGQIITAMITNIVNEITTKIELVTKLIPTVVEGITKIITEVPWLDILKSIGDGLLKGVTEAGDSLMKVGKELLGTIFGDSVLGDVGKALGGFFSDVGNWFGGAKETIEGAFNEAGEWITNAANGVADTVTGWWRSIFGGGDDGNKGAEEVKKGLDEIINTTRDSTEELSRTVVDSTHSNLLAATALLSNGLTDVFDKMCADAKITDRAKEQLREQADQLVSFLQAPDKSVQDIKTKFARLGIEITDELAGAIKGQGADDISYALQLLALGVDQETVAMLMDTNLSENIDQYMNDTGASIVDIANQLGADVGTGIGGTIPEAIAKALELGTKDIVKTKGEMVKEASITTEEVQSGSDSGSSMGSGVTGGVEAGMNEGKEGVETATNTVVQTIDDKLKELPEGEQENAKKMMDMLLAGILEGDPLVQTAIQESAQAVVNNVKEILSGDTGKEIALNFLNSMSGVFDSYQGIYVYANNLAVQCLQAVEAYVNYSNGAVIGSNMVVGMINGINAYGQTLVNAMAYICQCTAETARNILGIASPSKVFAEIGGFVMEGMENGINDTGRDAISAVGDVANSIIDEAKSADSVSVKVNAMTNGLDTVESKMSRIAKIFSDIADTITEMGGFEIPTVASGKVLPYRARVNTEPTVTESNALSNRNNLEDALYSAIMRAMGDNVEREQNVNVYLDGKDITDAVNKYQRQQSRAWGV